MRLVNIIKLFEFTEENRARIDLTGGLRLNPGGIGGFGRTRVELPADEDDPTLYSLTATLYCRSWTTTPMSAQEWRGFEAVIAHKLDPDGTGTVVTSARFRLRTAASEYWWDGAAWVVNAVNWNTEAEVAANIATFPRTTRTIGVVVNLRTTDARVTPELYAVKVLYGSDIQHEEDYLYRSFIPYLKNGVRSIARVVAAQVATGVTFTLAEALQSTPYDITDIDSVFNETTDPDHLTDLFASYNAGTRVITLDSAVTAGQSLFINLMYRPLVAAGTSRDFNELNRVPAILIEERALINATERGGFDTVMNNGVTPAVGVKVFTPKQGDYEMSVAIVADKGVDHARLAQDFRAFLADNPIMHSRGLDEPFRVWLIDDGEQSGIPQGNDAHSSTFRVRIVGAVFFERGSQAVTGVSGFGTSPDSTLNIDIP